MRQLFRQRSLLIHLPKRRSIPVEVTYVEKPKKMKIKP